MRSSIHWYRARPKIVPVLFFFALACGSTPVVTPPPAPICEANTALSAAPLQAPLQVASQSYAIVDGTQTPPREQVSSAEAAAFGVLKIQVDESSTIRCAATLISPSWVITAAHCAVDTLSWNGRSTTIAEYTYNPGAITFGIGPGTDALLAEIDIAEIYVHPQFRGPTYVVNDVALLRLAIPATDAVPGIVPISVNLSSPSDLVGQEAISGAFGSDLCRASSGPVGHQAWATTLVGDQTTHHLRTDDSGAGSFTAGDSGSAVAAKGQGDRLTIYGINSVSLDSTCTQTAAVRTDALKDWIQLHYQGVCDGASSICSGDRLIECGAQGHIANTTQAQQADGTTCGVAKACVDSCPATDEWCLLSCFSGVSASHYRALDDLVICQRCTYKLTDPRCDPVSLGWGSCTAECSDPQSVTCKSCQQSACASLRCQ